ncbi:hypothetical protein D9756_009807 [Leucocoprinus leucothites]|uniref:Uncharacterized protein n=1 Tax=Leucocoprinus leucothites TaxID=201217 RepID=A0A8H5CXA3_9AGAR|nr:hypothetical protein D9756_009807 [Leucoagaricus leucothites]
MGFQRTLSALLSHLPKSRQTLPFSAAQTPRFDRIKLRALRISRKTWHSRIQKLNISANEHSYRTCDPYTFKKNKSIFKIDELPVERFAGSFSLPGAPKVKVLSKEAAKRRKNASRTTEEAEARKANEKSVDFDESDGPDDSSEGSEESDSEDVSSGKDQVDEGAPVSGKAKKARAVRTKYDRMFERKNQNILSEHYSKLISHDDASDSEDDFIMLNKQTMTSTTSTRPIKNIQTPSE